jgi:hypothetical protein
MNTTIPSRGAELIAAERARQISEEGYTPEHDRGHGGELAAAADAYRYHGRAAGTPFDWPWAIRYWKPGTILRNLVRAGALYRAAAEAFEAEGQPAMNLRLQANRVAQAIDYHLARLDVFDIGEDGGAWFVANAQYDDEARLAIETHIDACGFEPEAHEEETQALAKATFEPRRLWFATGHGEGAVVTDEEPPTWQTGVWVVGR